VSQQTLHQGWGQQQSRHDTNAQQQQQQQQQNEQQRRGIIAYPVYDLVANSLEFQQKAWQRAQTDGLEKVIHVDLFFSSSLLFLYF
jgi:hypothetical protein